MNEYKDKIKEYIDAHIDEMISVLSEFISYPSYQQEAADNAPFGKANADVLDAFIRKCEEFGFSTKNFDGYAAHADMYSDNTKEKTAKLGILCHLDVVEEGTGWSSDPYKAEVRDGRIYGRGAIDDKGPLTAALFAMRCVKELGIPLSHGVRIITGCNEENGSSDMEYYQQKEKFPELLVTPDGDYPVINIEKGMIRCALSSEVGEDSCVISLHGGNVVNAVPECCEMTLRNTTVDEILSVAEGINGTDFEAVEDDNDKSIIHVKANGLCAHASTPSKGYNAITASLELVHQLAYDEGTQISVLNDLFPYCETNGEGAGVAMKDDASGELTLVLSVLDIENGKIGGMLDCRYPVCGTLERVSSKLCASLEADNYKAEIVLGSEPHYVDPDSDFIRTLLGVYEDITGHEGKCIAIGGGTYVHDTPNGVAFGAEFPGENNHMHGADESIRVESLRLNAVIYANAIAELLK